MTGVDARANAAGGAPMLGADYWRLWTSSGLSNLADGILKVGLPLVALTYTRSPALIAGLPFAFTLPWLLFALPAGALSDRLDRRRAMVGANLVPRSIARHTRPDRGSGRRLDLGAVRRRDLRRHRRDDLRHLGAVDRPATGRPGRCCRKPTDAFSAWRSPPTSSSGRRWPGCLRRRVPPLSFITPAALWLIAVAALCLVRGSFRVTATAPLDDAGRDRRRPALPARPAAPPRLR